MNESIGPAGQEQQQQEDSADGVEEGASAATSALADAEQVKEEDGKAFMQRQAAYRSIINSLKVVGASANRAATADTVHQTALQTLEYNLNIEHDRKMAEKADECRKLRDEGSALLKKTKKLEQDLRQLRSSTAMQSAAVVAKLERGLKEKIEELKEVKELNLKYHGQIINFKKEIKSRDVGFNTLTLAINAVEATNAMQAKRIAELSSAERGGGSNSDGSRRKFSSKSKVPPPPPPQPQQHDSKDQTAVGGGGSHVMRVSSSSASEDLAAHSSSSSSSSSVGAAAGATDNKSPKGKGKGALRLKKDISSRDRKRFTVKDAGATSSVVTVRVLPVAADAVPATSATAASETAALPINARGKSAFCTPIAPPPRHRGYRAAAASSSSSTAKKSGAGGGGSDGRGTSTSSRRGDKSGAANPGHIVTHAMEDSQLVTGSSSPPIDSRRRSRGGRGRAKRQKNTPSSSSEKEFSPISPPSSGNANNLTPIPIKLSVTTPVASATRVGGGGRDVPNDDDSRDDCNGVNTLKAYQDHFAGSSQTKHFPEVSPENKRKVDDVSPNDDEEVLSSKKDAYQSSFEEENMGMETMNALHDASMPMSNHSYSKGDESETSHDSDEKDETDHAGAGAGAGFKYQEVVRNKTDRKKMLPVDCVNCKKFFQSDAREKNMSIEEYMALYNHSRHRCTSEAPKPEDLSYWDMGFPSTQDDPQQVHIKETGGTKWRTKDVSGHVPAASGSLAPLRSLPNADRSDRPTSRGAGSGTLHRPSTADRSDRPASRGADMAVTAGDFAAGIGGTLLPSSERKTKSGGWITPKTGFGSPTTPAGGASSSVASSSSASRLKLGFASSGGGGGGGGGGTHANRSRSTTPNKSRLSKVTAKAKGVANAGSVFSRNGGVGDRCAPRRQGDTLNNCDWVATKADHSSGSVAERERRESSHMLGTVDSNFSAALLESAALDDDDDDDDEEDDDNDDHEEESLKEFQFGTAPPEAEVNDTEETQHNKQRSQTYHDVDSTFQTL